MHQQLDPTDAIGRLGKIVLGKQALPEILEAVARIATQVLPMATEASITLIDGQGAHTAACTSDVALRLDERQYESERGPCLDAAQSGERISIRDISLEDRWPQYAKAAAEHGIAASLSIPLPVQREVTGALNFYADTPDCFTDDGIELAETFAGHAAVAVANAHLYATTSALAEQMREAMATRAVIEQAKGIIMRDRGCDADEAFGVLTRLSQTSHTKLRDVARGIVDQVSKGRQ